MSALPGCLSPSSLCRPHTVDGIHIHPHSQRVNPILSNPCKSFCSKSKPMVKITVVALQGLGAGSTIAVLTVCPLPLSAQGAQALETWLASLAVTQLCSLK